MSPFQIKDDKRIAIERTPIKPKITNTKNRSERLHVGLRVFLTHEKVHATITSYDRDRIFVKTDTGNTIMGTTIKYFCHRYEGEDWKRLMTSVTDASSLSDLTMPALKINKNGLDEKFVKMGMEIIHHDGSTFYVLPMTYAPKFLRKSDGNLYEIPNFIRERLKTEVKCVLRKDYNAISLASLDMKHGFENFHGGDYASPFDSFCTGSLHVSIHSPADAVDARDRCQTMLEIIGYSEGPPITSVKGVYISEVKKWSIIPAKTRAFDIESPSRNFTLSPKDARYKALEKAKEEFKHLKDIIESTEKEEENINAQ